MSLDVYLFFEEIRIPNTKWRHMTQVWMFVRRLFRSPLAASCENQVGMVKLVFNTETKYVTYLMKSFRSVQLKRCSEIFGESLEKKHAWRNVIFIKLLYHLTEIALFHERFHELTFNHALMCLKFLVITRLKARPYMMLFITQSQ